MSARRGDDGAETSSTEAIDHDGPSTETFSDVQGSTLPGHDETTRATAPMSPAARVRRLRRPSLDPPTRDSSAPERIGRYEIHEQLGAGAMGEVYAAHDPELDRMVAIKLLRPEHSGRAARRARRRMAREAKVLAKLSHPNVVSVFDAGEHDDQVFIAMELVSGRSLRQWCNTEPRPEWHEIRARYLDAARGLAAAHASGLIHRDFKPDNVLVGDDGRVHVADFGLAAMLADFADPAAPESDPSPEALGEEIGESHESQRSSQSHDLVQGHLTRTGARMGTPAYMAPEQHLGMETGPYTDQYNFCASLYQSLYGVLPFKAEKKRYLLHELLARKQARNFEKPTRESRAPEWLYDVLVRGMEPDPPSRWPSMNALIAALGDDPGARRRRRMAMVAVAVIAVALVGFAAAGWLRRSETPMQKCQASADQWNQAWNGDLASRMQRGFAATGSSLASRATGRVSALLGAYGDRWRIMRTETCEATWINGQQSEAVLDLRMACLDRRLDRVRALAALLTDSPDREIVAQSLPSVLKLPLLEDCADVEALTAALPLPEDPDLRRRVKDLQRRVDEVEALHEAGKFSDALAKIRAIDGDGLDYPPLVARVKFQLAMAQQHGGAFKTAENTLRAMLPIAARAKDDALIARAWSQIIWIVGEELRQHEDALELEPLATMALDRADDDEARATTWTVLAAVLRNAGKLDQALVWDRKALALRTELHGPDHPDLADSLSGLGISQQKLGNFDEARRHFERGLELLRRSLGPDHPNRAVLHNNLGVLFGDLRDLTKARENYLAALTILEKVYGPDHIALDNILQNLGVNHQQNGEHDQALVYLRRALVILEKHHDPDHPRLGSVHDNLGVALYSAGKREEAVPHLRKAVSIKEKSAGPDHVGLASPLINLGVVLGTLSNDVEATELLQRAVAIRTRALGPEHPDLAHPIHELGGMANAAGDHDRALELNRRALEIREKTLGDKSPLVASSLSFVAATLWKGGKRREALGYAERSLAVHQAAYGPDHVNIAQSLNQLGVMNSMLGDHGTSEIYYRRALALQENAYGAEHPETIRTLSNMGSMLREKGDHQGAAKALERALSLAGEKSVVTREFLAGMHQTYGVLRHDLGDFATAEKHHRESLAIRQDALGPEHRLVAESLHNLAAVVRDLGRDDEARDLVQQAMALQDKVVDPDHPDRVSKLALLGAIQTSRGDLDAAETSYRESLRILHLKYGEDHYLTAYSESGLAGVARARGDLAQATRLHARALATLEKQLGAKHHKLSEPLLGTGEIRLLTGKIAAAVQIGERALALCAGYRCAPQSEFFLARALWRSGKSRARAKKLAQRARDAYRERGDPSHQDPIDAWLAAPK